MIFLTLPQQKQGKTKAGLFMSAIDVMTRSQGMIRIILNLHLMAMMTFNIRDLPPVLLVGGNDVSVLTSLT